MSISRGIGWTALVRSRRDLPANAAKRLISATVRPMLVRRWEGQAVIFCADSGDTLFSSELAVSVLGFLQSGPLDEASLILRMSNGYEGSREELVAATREALDELDALGLFDRPRP